MSLDFEKLENHQMTYGRMKMYFECDGCGLELDVEVEEFQEGIDWLKDQEWRMRPEEELTNGKQLWEHFCEKCKEHLNWDYNYDVTTN